MMSELDEARARLDRAADEMQEVFLSVVALRADPERHARAIVEQFGPAHAAWVVAGIEVATIEAEASRK